MIEDLVFKGKSLDECLNKAANFFGVDAAGIKYEFVDEAPEQEVWIQLTENPILAQRSQPEPEAAPRNEPPRRQPQVRASRGPRREDGGNHQRGGRDNRRQGGRQQGPRNQRGGRQGGNQNRNGGRGRNQRDGQQPRFNQGNFDSPPPNRGRRDNWKRSEVDLSGLAEVEREIHKFVTNMLDKMRLRAEVLPTQDQTRLILNIDGPDRNILLNRKGEALVAIQYLVNKIYMGRDEVQQPVYVDSMGYRVARDEELQEIAYSSAEKVRRSGKEYSLSPMNPYERRQIHVALKDEDGVSTISKGNGYIKRVSIIPSNE